ncbi:WecE Predicted pyridoxal phosphate-dependent enzyme apparently involved in regulation of cell wall biogenesis [uncultured Caudovirales phage]|uniref:WecE Predicted pyridoxal phosphate-dependent enzyme apparently involved in regulation of cell wall biogenesis n=1 Tax=uncultured Caudovirales phage TaxID=2100421 RepID=A0A6J5L754_9CAUD|nr:WecE Predicted pyridoxal phosphate-dependent enzyme apparently involved in regulation of cell wall biogenesis [uncultured Caudovirales phage]
MKEILDLVKKYVDEKQAEKTWVAGRDFVNYAGAHYDSAEYMAGVESLLKGWLAMGNDGLTFERKFPLEFGKTKGIVTNSGSSSNLLMMSALTSKRGHNLPKGTKVLMPIAGFPTTLNPTLQVGFTPVFVDIELDTLNLDLDRVEQALKDNPDIQVITFAHVLGNPPNMTRLMKLVKQYNLILLEDCCDALGSTYMNQPLGSFGLMASCSFYPAHHMTMGEGGFVATDDANYDVILRSFREWGRGCYCVGPEANKLKCGTCKKRFSEWIPELPGEIFDHKYVYDEIGYNLKPIELQCSMGLQQLKKLPEIHELRRRNYQLLFDIYEKYEEFFHLPRAQDKSDPSWFAFPLTVRKDAPFKRSDIVDYLEENLIQTRPYFAGNIMLQPAYSHLMNPADARDLFPNATQAMTNTYFHGTSPVITPEQIAYIGEKVDGFMSLFL